MLRSKISPLQLKFELKLMSFRLAIVVSSNPFNFVNVPSIHHTGWWKECTLKELTGLLLTTEHAKMTLIQAQCLAANEKFWTSTLSLKMCSRKQLTEPKIAIIFLRGYLVLPFGPPFMYIVVGFFILVARVLPVIFDTSHHNFWQILAMIFFIICMYLCIWYHPSLSRWMNSFTFRS